MVTLAKFPLPLCLPYFVCLGAGVAEGFQKLFDGLPTGTAIHRPVGFLAKAVLERVAFLAKAYRAPIVWLLAHARTASKPHMCDLYSRRAAAIAASMASHEVAVRRGTPAARALRLLG